VHLLKPNVLPANEIAPSGLLLCKSKKAADVSGMSDGGKKNKVVVKGKNKLS
jgi:hypothetical protein